MPLLRQQPIDERRRLGIAFGERDVARRRAVRARLLRVDRRALLVQELDDLVPALERGAMRGREPRDARPLKADAELRRAAVERRAGREQQLHRRDGVGAGLVAADRRELAEHAVPMADAGRRHARA